jgi:hypothetical protein
MKWLLRIEEFALFAASLWLFHKTDYSWWWYPALFLVPDLGMAGYVAGNRFGAATYNLTHHKAVALLMSGIGLWAGSGFLVMLGIVFLGHSSADRVLGYGLKHPTGFRYTHLGTLRGGIRNS